jgi:hypothetical protein
MDCKNTVESVWLGGATVACLAPNQEEAGSTPARALLFLPAGRIDGQRHGTTDEHVHDHETALPWALALGGRRRRAAPGRAARRRETETTPDSSSSVF